jgi:hypothetical protein
MFAAYYVVFWIPAVASAILLWLGWLDGNARPLLLFVTWFAVALVLQMRADLYSLAWVSALVGQAILAGVLSVKRKLG